MKIFSKTPKRHGFTLIEVMIAIAIIAVLATVSIVNLSGSRRKAALDSTTAQIAALLREAQSDSMAQKLGSFWGVYFDNTNPSLPVYELFYSTSTSGLTEPPNPLAVIVSSFPLAPSVCYATSSIPLGSSTAVVFSEIAGLPSAPATITLQLMTGGGCGTAAISQSTTSLTRTVSGKIFFDDFNRPNL
jgi:prepilin-type N-terminal cleavage/methylation domain-containing protein